MAIVHGVWHGVNTCIRYNVAQSTRTEASAPVASSYVIDRLQLRLEHQQAMLQHVRLWWPEDACGILGGPSGQVERVYLVENVLHSRTEYFMDPTRQVETMLEIEGHGWEVCGIFHSHPAGPPQPSRTDIDRAYYPDALYIILAPGAGAGWAMRGFEIDAGQVREIPLDVCA